MQNTSEHVQYVGSSPLRSRAQRSAVLLAALALLLGTLASLVPGIVSPIAAGAATTPVTWNTALTCGAYDYAVVPPGTTSITATIYGGGGGGGAGSGTGGTTAGNGGPAGSTTVTYAVAPGSDVGVDIGCGGGAGSTGATAAGGTGASGYAAGGSGGAGSGSSGDPGGGGGAGGGATGLCLGTTSGCTTPISIAPGGAGGGAAGGNNGAGCGNATAGSGGTGGGTGTTGGAGGAAGSGGGTLGSSGVAGTADTGDTGGSGVGGSGGGAGNTKSGGTKAGPGGGGGGGTGGAGGTNSTGGGTAGTGGANDTGGGGGTGANGGGLAGGNNGVGTGGAGGNTTTGTGNNMNIGGGGGGGGYTGGGGGGSTYCSGSDLSGAGGGGGGAGWSSSTATATSSGVATGTSASCTGTGTSNGTGGTGATTPAAGDIGCAGEVSSATFTGTAPGTPTESGSLNYTIGTAQSTATYAATNASSCDGTATYCEFTLASGALPTGLTLNTSTGVISGTPTGTAGNYTFTVTATNPYGTGSATATQTLVLAGGTDKLVFTTTPGTTNNGVTFSAQPVVKVETSSGTVVTSPSASVTLAIASGAGTLGGCTTNPLTTTAGVATFAGCEITGTPGTFTLSASSTGLTTGTSGNITISGTLKLAFTTTPGTTNNGVVFTAQPVVKIENSGGTVVATASAPVTLGVGTNPGGSVNCTTNPVTATSGVATFAGCAITGTAGTYTLSATSSGLTTGTSGNITIHAGAATQLVITTEPSATENSGAALAQQPVVKVEDSGGNVVTSVNSGTASATISGGGSIASGGTSGTFSSGVATFSGLTLNGVSGNVYTLTFSGDGFTSAASSNITMATGAATQLVITTEPSATENSGAALAQQPVVKVEDSGGNVVTSVNSGTASATIHSGTSGSIASGGTSGTFSSGVATFSGLTLNGVSGNVYTLTFSGDGFTSAASSNITMATGAATQLVITTEPSATENSGAALAQQPVVKVEDSGGNVVTSVNSGTASATIHSGTSGSIASGGTSGTFSSGVATFSGLTLNGVSGNVYTLTFSGDGFTSAASSNITMATGAATQLVITTEPSATENSGAALAQQPVVKVEDSGGNVVTSVNSGTASATIHSGTSGSIASGGTSGTFSSGVATFSGLTLNGVSGNVYTLTFSGDGFTSAASSNITMATGAATQLVITTEPSATENSGAALAQQPVVKVEDSGGNVVTSVNSGTASATIHSGTSGSIASGGTSGTFSSGVATFSGLTLNGVSGNVYTLTFSGDGFTSAASSNITMATGAATQLVITTEPSATENSGAALAQQPVVKVEDSGGNVVTSVNSGTASATIHSGTSGSIASGGTSGTFSSGVATFSGLTLNGVSGNVYTLTFSGDGFTSAASSNITMATGAATQLVITTEPSATENSGAALAQQPVVKVEDSGGNVVTSVNSGTASATIHSGTSGSIASGGTSGTFSSGVATFSGLTLNGVSGNVYTLTFSGDGFTSAASSNITMATGAATQLVITTEPSATENSGAALAQQPVVKVEDSGGNVVTSVNSGTASATIHSGTSGSIASGGTSGTFSSGVATFSGLTLNGVSGNVYTLTFSGDGFTSAASSNITMATGAATQLVITTEPVGNAMGTTTFATSPAVNVLDSGGNLVTAFSGTVTLATTSGSPAAGTLSCTNAGGLTAAVASGYATFSGCQIVGTGLPATYQLQATSSGLTSATSNTFTVNPGTATSLVFTSAPSSQAAAPVAGTSAFVVQAVDAFGNPVVNTGSSATVTLATNSTGTTFFTTSSGGSTESGTVSIPNGSSSSNTFYYADDTAGTWSISATATVDGNGVSTSPDATVVVGPASTTLTASGPATGNAGTAIDGSAVSSTMVGSSGTNATAPITFTVFGPGAEPTSCTSGGTTLGTATPAGDGTYTSSGTFTPTVAGDYWWYASSPGDANNNAAASVCASGMSETVVGPASPTLTASGPATGNAGTAIDGSAVSSTMVGSSGTNATAPITFTVFGPGAEPTSCTSGGTTLGTATPAGDGTYTSSGTFTPTVAGDYWWYASSPGDANNNAAASVCASGMSETVVGPGSPTLTASGPATGNAGTAIDGSAVSSTMVGSSGTNATAPITFTVFGPGAEPTSCTSGGTTLGTATPAGDGTYTSSGTFTPTVAGDYWWYASSPGDANNNAAASVCASGMSETVVGPAISATVVTSSANPAAYGATVTLTATVTGAATYGAPAGTVAFTDGSYTALTCGAGSDSTLTPISSSASSATCLYTPPAVGGVGGTFNTIGTYSGDSSYVASAGSLAQEVLGTLPTVGVNVFSANPSPNGATVTLNGTLIDNSDTANPATAAGSFAATVAVINEGTKAVVCANAALSPTGAYTAGWSCTFTPTGPGQRLVLATNYSGNDTFAFSSVAATLVVAGTASTTPSVTASPTTVPVGASTTLQATLTGSPAPTGNVTFLDDGTPIAGCGLIVVQSGGAQSKCAYSPASVGSHSITVTYSGNVDYAAAGPSAAATVVATGTTTSVTATPTLVSPSAPVPNADPITVSTVVSGSGATPTGTVAFSATIGSSTSTPCVTAPLDGSGTASCTFTPAFVAGAGGTVSITAVYSGDDTYSQSTSGPLSVNVLAIGLPSTFTLTTTKSPMTVGSSATLTAQLTGSPLPGGTVSFTDNGSPLPCGAVTVSKSTGKAACTYTPTWGTHALVATYSGNATYAPITASTVGFANSTTLVVNSTGASTVAVTSSANPSATGAAITFGATITGTLSPVPTGTVTFSATIGSSTTTACMAVAVSPSTGTSATAGCTYTPPDSGNTITITAAYSGNPTYAPQSGTFTQTELGTAAPASFTLTTTKSPLTVGSSATLTATLKGSPTPDGTVSFTDNGSPLSCGAVTVLKTGKATCAYTPAWGSHALVATYSGNATYAPITASTVGFANSATIVVNSTGASTVAVTSSADPSAYGLAVTLTASVAGSLSSAPTGTITFTASAGTLSVGCAAAGLTATGPSTSAATCILTPPTSGTGVIMTVNASYSGDPTYAPEAAAAFSQTENGTETPSITLTSSANPAAPGTEVTFTAAFTGTVKPGTVTFTDNGTAVCTAVAIANSLKATCADTVSGSGVHTIVASYSGDTTYAAGHATLNETVS